MPALHQMGHNSENLLREQSLGHYRGAILSPVNYSFDQVIEQIANGRSLSNFRVIFDPQLYFPNSERGQLPTWTYFPSDVDTADLSSDLWWTNLVEEVATVTEALQPDAVCSPAVVPRTYENEYFEMAVNAADKLADRLSSGPIKVLQTAVVGLPELTRAGRALEIASVLTSTTIGEVYLVLVGSTEPQRELRDEEEIKGAMRLIRALEESGVRVTVGFSSSDIVLWKYAGATSCATGKFFNLRRFTRTRFDEPGGGGGQLPYWFEESLLAFLRESDLVRAIKGELLSDASTTNPYGQEIISLLASQPGTAWVAKGWRQYMWWFADIEGRVSSNAVDVPQLLKHVEQTWQDIADKILMEVPENDGRWLRSWRRACIEFNQ